MTGGLKYILRPYASSDRSPHKEAKLTLVLFLKPFRSGLTNNLHDNSKRERRWLAFKTNKFDKFCFSKNDTPRTLGLIPLWHNWTSTQPKLWNYDKSGLSDDPSLSGAVRSPPEGFNFLQRQRKLNTLSRSHWKTEQKEAAGTRKVPQGKTVLLVQISAHLLASKPINLLQNLLKLLSLQTREKPQRAPRVFVITSI